MRQTGPVTPVPGAMRERTAPGTQGMAAYLRQRWSLYYRVANSMDKAGRIGAHGTEADVSQFLFLLFVYCLNVIVSFFGGCVFFWQGVLG